MGEGGGPAIWLSPTPKGREREREVRSELSLAFFVVVHFLPPAVDVPASEFVVEDVRDRAFFAAPKKVGCSDEKCFDFSENVTDLRCFWFTVSGLSVAALRGSFRGTVGAIRGFVNGDLGRGHDVGVVIAESRAILGILRESDGGADVRGVNDCRIDERVLTCVRNDGGGGLGNFAIVELLVDKTDSGRTCDGGTKLRSGSNPVDGEAMKTGTSASCGVVTGDDALSAELPTSIGGEFGRGTEAASSPSCTRLLEPVAFKPG